MACSRSSVRHMEADGGIPAGILPRRSNSEIAVSELRIAQPVSEVIERAVNSRLLTFPLRLGLGRKIERDLSDRLRKSHRQLSAGVVVAEQNVGDRSAALRAGKPCFQNPGHVLVYPVDAHRSSVDENHNDEFAASKDCLLKFQLVSGKIQTGARRRLSNCLRRITQDD